MGVIYLALVQEPIFHALLGAKDYSKSKFVSSFSIYGGITRTYRNFGCFTIQ